MGRLAILHALEARLGLLARPGSEQQRLINAAHFTRAAAWELRAEGWGNIRKEHGTQVDGLDTDKILNGATGEVVDVVRNAGAPDQSVAWQVVGTLGADRWVEPRPFDGAPTPAPAPTPPRPPLVDPNDHRAALLAFALYYAVNGESVPPPIELARAALEVALELGRARASV